MRAPGAAVQSGEVLVEVDGRAVDAVTGPWPLLVGTAGKPVELRLRAVGSDDERTKSSWFQWPTKCRCATTNWVADRRGRACTEATEGRLGYLHVPDMMALGWAQLHRDLRAGDVAARRLVRRRTQQRRRAHCRSWWWRSWPEVLGRMDRATAASIVDTYPQDAPTWDRWSPVTDENAGLRRRHRHRERFRTRGLGPVVGDAHAGAAWSASGLRYQAGRRLHRSPSLSYAMLDCRIRRWSRGELRRRPGRGGARDPPAGPCGSGAWIRS